MFRKIVTPILVLSSFTFFGYQYLGGCDPITRKQMKDMLVQLGYTVKNLDSTVGKEKYSVVIERSGLNIPVALEISPNERYIWLTVYLQDSKPDNGSLNYALLQENANIQPCQFYVTKSGKMMMASPVENKGVTNVTLREKLETIAGNVVDKKSVWQH